LKDRDREKDWKRRGLFVKQRRWEGQRRRKREIAGQKGTKEFLLVLLSSLET